MKKRFTEEQIIRFLREAEAGLPVKELCRRHGFSEATHLRAKNRWLDTGSTRWRRIRASILARDPLCVMCPPKRRQMSTIVDHVNGRADRPEDYADDNLQGLCWSCHSSKTGHQRAGTTAENKGYDEAGNPLAGWRR